MTKKINTETRTVQANHYCDPQTGSIVPAIYTSTTYARDKNYQLISENYSYGRDENPSFAVPERVLADLEGGEEALLFSSGMSAAIAVFQALEPGDHVVAPEIMYWGLREWLKEFSEKWGVAVTFYDVNEQYSLKNSIIKDETKLVWIETPCNPTWGVIDIEEAAEISHQNNAYLVVDSTVSTPVITRPIDFGADIVMHSATKYLNGHGDVVAGALVCQKKDALWKKIHHNRIHGGAIPSPFDAWLLLRGMRTLFIRMEKINRSAMKIAKHFENNDHISEVLYPGLTNHKGHKIAKKQMKTGFGGMLSLRIKGGEETALEIVKNCTVFMRATSLGGVESLIEHRYSIEGENSPIPRDLIRISVGIEYTEDLINDLEKSIKKSIKS